MINCLSIFKEVIWIPEGDVDRYPHTYSVVACYCWMDRMYVSSRTWFYVAVVFRKSRGYVHLHDVYAK